MHTPADGRKKVVEPDMVQFSRRRMLKRSGAALAAISLLGTTGCGEPQSVYAGEGERVVPQRQGSNKPRIVLVHGAWADGTGWQHIIPLLEDHGYPVIAVQNPLTSFADDIATTKRVIDAEAQKGSVKAAKAVS